MGNGEVSQLDREFDHERVELVGDPETGLRGVIAIHSRALGPAMGGVRFTSYPGFEAATVDALRLACHSDSPSGRTPRQSAVNRPKSTGNEGAVIPMEFRPRQP